MTLHGIWDTSQADLEYKVFVLQKHYMTFPTAPQQTLRQHPSQWIAVWAGFGFYHLVFCMSVFVRKKCVLACRYLQKASYRKILTSLLVKLIWQHFWYNADYHNIILTRPLFYLKKSEATVRNLLWKYTGPNFWKIEKQNYNVIKALISTFLLKWRIIWAVKFSLFYGHFRKYVLTATKLYNWI